MFQISQVHGQNKHCVPYVTVFFEAFLDHTVELMTPPLPHFITAAAICRSPVAVAACYPLALPSKRTRPPLPPCPTGVTTPLRRYVWEIWPEKEGRKKKK
jgi:hypothetical protein